jgi:hypothetical protein
VPAAGRHDRLGCAFGGERVELVGGANAAYPYKDYPLKISWDLWDVIEAADSR